MSLSPGSKLGSYEVLAPLGAGGMGEVYRARDTRLGRDVALKVLPAEQMAAESRRKRFVHEARAASALNHPNIVTIHEIESANGIDFIVMEYVPGKTLEALIRPGMRLGDALKLAIPLADALARAHAAGIVHRDLKPSNVVVSDEGVVKVLDFGLAKLVGDGDQGPEGETASAEALSLSRPGTIAGTPGYMSPEQVSGGKVDARSDVFAFGALLYEMVTGRRAFARPSAPETLAAVLREEPQPPSGLVPGLPRQLEKLILRCLMKEPERRSQHMSDVKVELLEIIEEAARQDRSEPPAPARLRWFLLKAGPVIGALLAAFLLWRWSRPDRAEQVVRFELASVPLADLTIPAVSPDGARIVYSASKPERQLQLRALDSLQATPLPGTVRAFQPFFSPDGRSIGFFKDRALMTMDLATSQLTRVSSVPGFIAGATWGQDGRIYFSALYAGLLVVPASGGTPQPLATPKPTEGLLHGWPELLPGGRHVLFTVWRANDLDHAKVDVLTIDTGHRQTLLEGAVGAKYLPSGHLAYITAESSLFVIGFDLRSLQVRGPPVRVLDGVGLNYGGYPFYAVSLSGTLAYHRGSMMVPLTQIVLASGRSEQSITAPPGFYGDPSLSPDDRRLAVSPFYGARLEIWVHEFARGTWTRLTTPPWFAAAPVWHPADPNAIVFTTARPGKPGSDLFAMPADGSGPAELLYSSPYAKYAVSSAASARLVAFVEMRPDTGADLWLLELRGKPVARPFLQTPAREKSPSLSPDGRWLAYDSDESGRMEVYVRPVSGAAGKWMLSPEGGERPRWSRDGKRILYAQGDRLMAVDVAAGASFTAQQPRFLLESKPVQGRHLTPYYDIALDGRLLLVRPAAEQPTFPLVVVQNWFSELSEKLGR